MSERSPLLSSASRSDSIPDRTDISRHDEHTSDGTGVSFTRGSLIALAIFLLLFAMTFGVSMFTTVQSSIAKDLDVTSGVSWFVSAYLIAATSVLPVAGRLCQIFSPKSYLLVSTVIQAVGLLFTGLAPTFGAFMVGRVVCGIGASAATPVAFLLVTELATQKRRGTLFGLINVGYTLGIALGAVVGGGLEPLVGWRAVFWIQAPICLAAGTLAYFTIPSRAASHMGALQDDRTVMQKLACIDYLGVVTLISAVVLLLYTLASPHVHITPLLLAAASFTVFCLIEAQWAAEPIVPLAIVTSRAMLLTGIATLGLMSARWGVLFYTPTFAIAVRGWTQAQAGLLLIPTNLGFGSGSVIVGLLHIRRAGSFYWPCVVCFVLFILDHFVLSRLMAPESSIWLIIPVIFLNGALAGALLTYNLTHLLHLLNPADHVIAIPLNAMYRSLSGSLGSALSGGLFLRSLQSSLSRGFEQRGMRGKDKLIAQLLSRPLLVQELQGAEREVALHGYSVGLQYLFAAGCLLSIFMLFCQAGTGWNGYRIEQIQGGSKSQDADSDEDARRTEP